MTKLISIMICLPVLFVSTNFAQKQTGKQPKVKTSAVGKVKSSKAPKFVCKLSGAVIYIDLSRTEIAAECPASDEVCSSSKIIKVKLTAVYVGEAKFVYTVSAGKIVGEGYDVEWDLSNVAPGSYTITAGISEPTDYSSGWSVGQTKTRTVVIK